MSPAGGYTGHTHGDARGGKVTPEYRAWQSMKNRCLRPGNPWFRLYGARGIAVHPPWINSFETFLRDVGRRPSRLFSLDRIDNDGNYEPGNVRWATAKEQTRNQRNSRLFVLNGEKKTLGQWCEEHGAEYEVVFQRIDKYGWDVLRALTTPKGERPGLEKHEMDRLYLVWWAMVSRCHDPTNARYKDYGGRGIHVFELWRESFKDFYDAIISTIGSRPSRQYSLDRIDGDRGYEPGNIRWATWTEQVRNRRNTKLYSLSDQTHTLSEWAAMAGIPYARLKQRVLTFKWPLDEALGTPVGGSGRMSKEDRRSWKPSNR